MASFYSQKLRNGKWQRRRLEILERDNFCCRACFDENNLSVHHVKYLKKHDPWDYPDDYLITLCDDCHEEWHRIFDKNENPGRTFLVSKVHFDLDIEGMQEWKEIKRKLDGRMD
jgi:5-methylcytosine-specific restriction endonuclease McrA